MRLIFIIYMSCGLLFLVIGLYILKSKKIEFLSSLDCSKKYNRDTLAKFAGRNLITMGILVIIQNTVLERLSYIWEFMSVPLVLIIGFFITVMYFSLKIAFGVRKFEK